MNCAVIAVHPDDETIGCGGTLLRHKQSGDSIHWIIMTKATEKEGYTKTVIENREQTIKEVARAYPFDSVHRLNFSTTRLDTYPTSDLVKKINQIFMKIKPSVVILPFCADVHSDHRITFEAAFSCTKTFRNPFIRRILMMETLSETEFSPAMESRTFRPNFFVDISDMINRKLEIASLYDSELKEFPFPRSLENIKALAMFRGAASGSRYCESFMLLKEIR